MTLDDYIGRAQAAKKMLSEYKGEIYTNLASNTAVNATLVLAEVLQYELTEIRKLIKTIQCEKDQNNGE